jgi:hypothetical protein
MNDERKDSLDYPDDFLRDSYRGLLKHLITSVDDSLSPNQRERRHEHHLRRLLDDGKFDEAYCYLDAMIEFCERHDFKETWRYDGYRKRVELLSQSSLNN